MHAESRFVEAELATQVYVPNASQRHGWQLALAAAIHSLDYHDAGLINQIRYEA